MSTITVGDKHAYTQRIHLATRACTQCTLSLLVTSMPTHSAYTWLPERALTMHTITAGDKHPSVDRFYHWYSTAWGIQFTDNVIVLGILSYWNGIPLKTADRCFIVTPILPFLYTAGHVNYLLFLSNSPFLYFFLDLFLYTSCFLSANALILLSFATFLQKG